MNSPKKNAVILAAMVAAIAVILYSYKSGVQPQNNTDGAEIATGGEAIAGESTAAAIPDLAELKAKAASFAFTPSVPDGAVDVAPLVYGDPKAPIIIEEFASFTCSHCAHFHRDILPKLKSELLDSGLAQLRVYSFPRNAQDVEATLLVQCQKTDEARKSFNGALFDGQEQWAFSSDYQDGLKTIARVGGMDDAGYDACVKDEAMLQKIIGARQWYDAQVKVEATPYFRIGNEVVKGAMGADSFVEAIRKLLNPQAAAAAAPEVSPTTP